MNDGLRDAVTLTRARFGEATLDAQLGELPRVYCHPARINQVFLNVLLNAAEAVDAPGVIEIRSRTHEDGVEIVVKDDGVGISKDDLPKIFDPGFTTKSKSRGVGAGLGLSVAYQILNEHHGRIEVESEPGAGTVVVMWIPSERDA